MSDRYPDHSWVARFHLAKRPEILYPTFSTRLALFAHLHVVLLGFVGDHRGDGPPAVARVGVGSVHFTLLALVLGHCTTRGVCVVLCAINRLHIEADEGTWFDGTQVLRPEA